MLLGTDPYLRDLCRKQIVEACVPEGAREWAVARVRGDGEGWNEALERVQTMPMLAPKQVIIVEDAELIEKLGDDSRDEILGALGKYLDSPAAFSVLLIEAEALDRRQRFYKVLAEKALLVELTIGSESAASLAVQMAKESGVEIDRAAATLLADILNGEPARIRIEIDKLAAYAQDRGRIATSDVEALVVAARKNTVWQLADMLATRERAAAMSFLDNLLREGEEPVRLVGALAWRYRKLVEARGLPRTTSGWQAAKQLGMNPNDAEAAIRNAHRVSKAELLAGLVELVDADSQLKSSNPNPRAFMEFLIARLTSTSASAA
ncbi:MAG TPA: DNA polymerase III subunit delta [Terriglobales bacterium]|nr:DNA polymerase III subunit delta [Terriglobales bacterium]